MHSWLFWNMNQNGESVVYALWGLPCGRVAPRKGERLCGGSVCCGCASGVRPPGLGVRRPIR